MIRDFRKLISVFTVITVISMVLFGIICPELGMRKMAHSSCSGMTGMYHLSSAEEGGCLNLHIENQNLPSLIPDSLSTVVLLLIAIAIYNSKERTKLLIDSVSNILKHRWRAARLFFESEVKPILQERFFSWFNIASGSLVTV